MGGGGSESSQLHQQEGSITKLLHLRPLPLSPLERWLLGAAAAAQPPFSCSSPLLLLRRLFFPLLLFWLGILRDLSSRCFYSTSLSGLCHPPTGSFCGMRLCIVLSRRRRYGRARRARGATCTLDCSADRSDPK